MEKTTLLIGVVVVLLVVVVFQTLQLVTINNHLTGVGNFQGYSSYDKMMEAHHGDGSNSTTEGLATQQGGC